MDHRDQWLLDAPPHNHPLHKALSQLRLLLPAASMHQTTRPHLVGSLASTDISAASVTLTTLSMRSEAFILFNFPREITIANEYCKISEVFTSLRMRQ